MSFEITKEEVQGNTVFKFIGHIDEDATFPTYNGLKGDIFIDLGAVKSINSVGIRSWIKWFTSLEDTQLIFQNCPKSVVMQMNMVEGFLPAQSKIESIHVPFYCEDCDEEVEVLFYVGKEIKIVGNQVKLDYDKATICPDGNDPELDVSETKYFKFLFKTQSHSQAA